VIESLKSDKGTTRESNQDSLVCATNSDGNKIYVLCDGMGGYKGGEIASLKCSTILKDKFMEAKFIDVENAKKWLYDTIMLVNKKIIALSKKNDEISNMGTTLVCLIITKDFRLYASVGDSRIYTYNHKELTQISEDQTFANALLKAGYINEKEAQIHPKKNILVCAIGSHDDDLDVQISEINGQYNYLLCSDGLYNMVEHKEIFKVINNGEDIENRAQTLINLANEHGGKDNVSVILVEGDL